MARDGERRAVVAGRRKSDRRQVPWQVTVTAQGVLDAVLGDEIVPLGELGELLARLAEVTGVGAEGCWTADRVVARCRELDELYNPAEPACRVCGCTEWSACPGGCSWVPDPDGAGALCSVCLPLVAAVRAVPA